MVDPAEVFCDLVRANRWVAWRLLEGRKVPICPSTGKSASTTSPGTWCDYAAAVCARDVAGPGLVFVPDDDLGGVDLDGCYDAATAEVAAWAMEVVRDFASYTEVSPSRSGLKIYARGAPAVLPGNRIGMGAANGGKAPAIEAFVAARYFAVTGEHLDGTPAELVDAPEAWERLAYRLRQAANAAGTGNGDGRKPRVDALPEGLAAFLDADQALMQLWRGSKPSGDSSASAKDASLVARLYQAGAPTALLKAALHAYPYGHIGSGKLTGQAAERRIKRLLAFGVRPLGTTEQFDLTQDGLALELGEEWGGHASHVALWGNWLFWDGEQRWVPDEKLVHMTRTRAFLREKGKELIAWAERFAQSGADAKKVEAVHTWARCEAKRLRVARTVADVVGLARSNTGLAGDVGQWDADPFLLGATGATVDLRGGVRRTPEPGDYITKTVAVDPAPPGTEAPLWAAFLERITAGDLELQAYLRRLAGYCLTGSVREHLLAFAYRTGANGKGVFVNTLVAIWSHYAVTVSTDMLMVSQTDRHPTEVARLRGARLVVGSEVEVGRTWAESRVKHLTGGDRLQGRFMRQDFFEFGPQFKLLVVGNHKPSLRGVDEAVRRRLHLIPFAVTIPPAERDPELSEKLKAEWPAILRWAIDGCQEWQRTGLSPPSCVRAATDEYLAAEDTFERWRDECTTADPNAWEKSADLWASWKAWAENAAEFVGKRRKFIDRLVAGGFTHWPGTGDVKGYFGARLNARPQP